MMRQVLLTLGARQDLAFAMLLVTTIIMMILPLPTLLVDIFLACNIALAVMLLMVAVYLRDPLDFSTLPSVILISTLFRLALSITTTRLILLQADAGEIIETFGEFVVGGNLVVGLVVFLIITVVQFVVITKGSERIAEVSARFSLDALPGKQMSIDADLRNGDIDQAEARRRRQHLEKESQLYGAMDGAMKFVKGDAIAGLVIIAVNLLGGIAVGTLQQDMSLGEALMLYSLLTVGDGLVAQIPALFLSIASGAIVTRVSTEDSVNLASDISKQIVAEPRTLQLAAGVCAFLGFVPGFPTMVFWGLAAVLGGLGAAFAFRRQQRLKADEESDVGVGKSAARAVSDLPTSEDALTITLAEDLALLEGPAALRVTLDGIASRLIQELGTPFPQPKLALDPALPSGGFRINIDDVPVGKGAVPVGELLIDDDPTHLTLADVPTRGGGPLMGQETTVWAEGRHAERLKRAGIGFLPPLSVLAGELHHQLRQHAAYFIGVQETQALLARAEMHFGELARGVQNNVSPQRVAEVLRRLLDDGVPLRNQRLLLEGLLEWGAREPDMSRLTECVRMSLRRQICHQYADDDKLIAGIVLERHVEDLIRRSRREPENGGDATIALPGEVITKLVNSVRQQLVRSKDSRATPVVLTALDLRRHVRALLIKHGLRVPVLAYDDLAGEFRVHVLTTIRLRGIVEEANAPASSAA